MKKVFKVLMCFLLPILVVFSCKPADPCATVVCQNSGTCGGNGLCSCPSGYTGNFCETEKIPRVIVIKSVVLTKFPPTTSNGGGWDVLPSSGPDLFPRLYLGTTLLWESLTIFYDATIGNRYRFIPISPIRLTDVTQSYTIRLYDSDATTNEYMGGIQFTPSGVNIKGFPNIIELSCATCTAAFDLDVSYEF